MEDPITRDEFNYRFNELKEDLNKMGNSMREALKDNKQTSLINLKDFKTVDFKEYKDNMRDDFKSVWKAIDGMLIKVGMVVTITSTLVMLAFKIAEKAPN